MSSPVKYCAANMIVEDHLKQMLSKTSGRFWRPSDNKLVPRRTHCVFGDFPKDMMPLSTSKSPSPTKISNASSRKRLSFLLKY